MGAWWTDSARLPQIFGSTSTCEQSGRSVGAFKMHFEHHARRVVNSSAKAYGARVKPIIVDSVTDVQCDVLCPHVFVGTENLVFWDRRTKYRGIVHRNRVEADEDSDGLYTRPRRRVVNTWKRSSKLYRFLNVVRLICVSCPGVEVDWRSSHMTSSR